MGFAITWIVLSLLVALSGSGKKIGYWGVFFLSLFLSPLIGLIIGLVSGTKSPPSRNCQYCQLEIKDGSQFCPGCEKDIMGKTLADYKTLSEDKEYQTELAKEAKKSKQIKYIIIGAILLIVIIGILWGSDIGNWISS